MERYIVNVLVCEWLSFNDNVSVLDLKVAQSRYFELFWPHTKLPLNGRKPENNSLIR